MSIEPDTNDRTWVVDRSRQDCGFDPAVVEPARLVDHLRDVVHHLWDIGVTPSSTEVDA